MRINWNDNINPALKSACHDVAAKALENATALLETEKERRCQTGDTSFGIAFGPEFFKGMADSARLQFQQLMREQGYEFIYIWKGFLGNKRYELYVPKDVYNFALQMSTEYDCYKKYKGNKGLERALLFRLKNDVAWYE